MNRPLCSEFTVILQQIRNRRRYFENAGFFRNFGILFRTVRRVRDFSPRYQFFMSKFVHLKRVFEKIHCKNIERKYIMTKEVKRLIFVVLFCEFLICLGMSLIFPVEPFIKNEYHFTAFDMGVMSSLFAFVQFIASPIVGRISDKVGRKPMLVCEYL